MTINFRENCKQGGNKIFDKRKKYERSECKINSLSQFNKKERDSLGFVKYLFLKIGGIFVLEFLR